MPRKNTKDWRNLPIEDWNVLTFTQFVVDNTRERFGAEYLPGGSGSRQQRWARERGMLKNAQQRYGNAVIRRFIELCWRNYRTSNPQKFPYPTICFMFSYMDRYLLSAQADVEFGVSCEIDETAETNESLEDLREWL